MKSTTTSQKSIDSLSAYRSARLFEQAGNMAEQQIGMRSEVPLFTPVIINSAFSLEIYIKCLIMIETGSRPSRGVTLSELFASLSNDSKTAIEQYFDETTGGAKPDFLSIINEISVAFALWLDAHEKFNGQSLNGVGAIFYAVKRRIRELKPEWTEEILVSAIS